MRIKPRRSMAIKTQRTIRNCLPMFRFVCPKRWDQLTPGADPIIRHCGHCDRRVHFCKTDEETIAHARAGDCIAREYPDASGQGRVILGKPSHVERATPLTLEQEEAARMRQRELGVDDAIKNVDRSARTCPQCKYPAPDWRTTCRVCGFAIGRVNPMPIDPMWLTSTVVALVTGIYEQKVFDRMPILADALQDAGCENADILNHCREPGQHDRGCWVVNLFMGK
jgi:hypothetical protein